MYISTYCVFILLGITLCFGVPIKTSNKCGYDVREFNDFKHVNMLSMSLLITGM